MQDILKDIVKHTHSLGSIQAAKVTTAENGTAIDAMDDDLGEKFLNYPIQKQIIEEFESAPCEDRSKLLNYFIHNKLKELTDSIGEF